MRAWRIARPVWEPLAGEGARRRGGRWNSPGFALVYTSERLSLAVLETLVHVEPNSIPPDLFSYEIDIPKKVRVGTVSRDDLPHDWEDHPGHIASRALGDAWIASNESAALLVPSAIIPGEMNLLLNPNHADARLIRVIRTLPFRFDLGLLRE